MKLLKDGRGFLGAKRLRREKAEKNQQEEDGAPKGGKGEQNPGHPERVKEGGGGLTPGWNEDRCGTGSNRSGWRLGGVQKKSFIRGGGKESLKGSFMLSTKNHALKTHADKWGVVGAWRWSQGGGVATLKELLGRRKPVGSPRSTGRRKDNALLKLVRCKKEPRRGSGGKKGEILQRSSKTARRGRRKSYHIERGMPLKTRGYNLPEGGNTPQTKTAAWVRRKRGSCSRGGCGTAKA